MTTEHMLVLFALCHSLCNRLAELNVKEMEGCRLSALEMLERLSLRELFYA